MRIVHLITRLILGGAQENTVLSCEDLIRIHGDQVLLLAGPPLGPEGSLVERVLDHGVPLHILPSLVRAIRPLADWQSYREIKRAIRTFRPDVVHTHSGKAGLLGRAAAHALGVPAIVHTVHGAPFHPYQGRGQRALFRACERYAAKRCDALVSVADAMTDLLVDAGVASREKFTTIYSGMDVESFLDAARHRAETRRALGYGDQHVVVGKVARLFHLKGHAYLIRAAEQAVAQQPNLRFLVVGDGILREQIRDQVRRASLESYFHFTGLVPTEQIPALIGAMDIVAHVSLREGLARVLPQALVAGKPVISFDVDGAREVVITNETGILLPAQNVDELAAGLCRLAADASLRERLGSRGRELFTDRFRHERMTRDLRTLYERILSDKGRAGPH
ncbi:MAG TPA: glycosyltransferase family 4 protein [Pirellulales bacterium]|jgi:glycosyltransferase involved in cell wall biosynthesis|nr:glycosyltransferase family 4 protein [Pirellulales bacterium]